MASSIWVAVDQAHGQITGATKEMLQDAEEAARPLGMEVWAILVDGKDSAGEPWPEQVGAYGATHLFRIQTEGLSYVTAEAFSAILEEAAKEISPPRLVLMANTFLGQEAAVRLAARWQTGFANDCVGFSIAPDGRIEATRVTHGEQVETIVTFARDPAIISFRPGSAGIGGPASGRKAEEHTCRIELLSHPLRQKIRRFCPADQRTVDITEADLIIAGGQGVGSKENFATLQELADTMGAAVAGTRLADDKGWISVDRRVGLTGKTVSPQFYIAFGISGAREHVVGMNTSKVVVAVNTEPRAEIFRLAHLGVISDAREVMKALLQKLKEKRPEVKK